MVTSGTYHKQHFFDTEDRLSYLESALVAELQERGWEIHAWAVFANHYHFVGRSPEAGLELEDLTAKLHRATATEVNLMDDRAGRRVWYRCWDTMLTYQRSYLARLAYVHGNAVKHGLVKNSKDTGGAAPPGFAKPPIGRSTKL